ncbi:MAG: thioredoxin fold domain-containing protein [Deltaproteobacteria bacterium]|jgi:thioredoxin-related protein|nr:thioredoxin fold domain-containing protein [Deltaproteobacteria bacterium]
MNKPIILTIVLFGLILFAFWAILPQEPAEALPQTNGTPAESREALVTQSARKLNSTLPLTDGRDFSNIGLKNYNLQEAQELASSTDKYTIMYFWASWCHNCRFFEEEVLPNPQVVETINNSFAFVSLDFDNTTELVQELRLRSVPTFIFVTPEGEYATILPGAVPPDIFVLVLNFVSTGSYKSMDFENYVDTVL